MPGCTKCGKRLLESQKQLSCGRCSGVYHLVCTSLSEEDLGLLAQQQQHWQCSNCATVARATRNDDTPVRNISALVHSSSASSQPDALSEMVKELLDRVKSLQNNQCELQKSLSFWEQTVSEQAKQIESLNSATNKLCDQMSDFSRQIFGHKASVTELENRVNILEQESLKNTIEIHGVPAKDGEVVSALVSQVGLAIGIKVDQQLIDYAYRVRYNPAGDASRPPPIIVRFLRYTNAEEFLDARRVKRNLYTKDLGWNDLPSRPIYVNCRLTSTNRELFSKARELKRQGKIKFIWLRNGKIYAREREGSERVLIRSMCDIENFK
ncbi:uncharacterized protein LOC124174228 [Ischnura elegans]|uniref:uncharacterized protein LOC124174228 n=1 Tax=Ischnura elegans TaxID=197161 RepID=UPI001ED8A153|nr:uncharacterized protein LOC124174228 [Ischnura elegans]